jgi:hypothetical protein
MKNSLNYVSTCLRVVDTRRQTQPEDLRLHVEPGGNFRTLQEAAMRVTAEYESNRQRARREMLAQHQPDAQRIQDGRRINREFADMKRPRRQLKTSGE